MFIKFSSLGSCLEGSIENGSSQVAAVAAFFNVFMFKFDYGNAGVGGDLEAACRVGNEIESFGKGIS